MISASDMKGLRCLNFCPGYFDHVETQFKKKAKVNFKIYDFKNWKTNNYNTYIAQYLKK